MCDTVVALSSVTSDGKVYFAKNSDREPNEAQYLHLVEGSEHETGSMVNCTYISIPQIKKTNTVLLSQPFWMWGAEMGANDKGVVIGNEALFTKIKPGKKPGLIGMDMLRLALERSQSAEDALHILIGLIETYGQSGNCSFDHRLYYHNSFLVADRHEAWVLETADCHWAALRVKDFYSISNGITIERNWDLVSEDLIKFAIDRKWCKSKSDFNFKQCYSDFLYTRFSQAQKRRCETYSFLKQNCGRLDIHLFLSILRTHNTKNTNWRPDRSLTEWTICMHKGFGPIRNSQTTGSMVSRLSEEGDLHFVTATSAPCTGIFKPVWLDLELPLSKEPIPTNHFDMNTTWWKHEKVHRKVLKNYAERLPILKDKRDKIEMQMLKQSLSFIGKPKPERQFIEDQAFYNSEHLTEELITEFESDDLKGDQQWLYEVEWERHNKKAGM